jgi:D-beta-D-heptose 7-phosphate kinase/D-beta-D-heptose 1-phosphate adenosyltransferase
MVDLSSAFQHLKEKNVLVLGDFMCDLYTKGKAHRVSPEAPVVVLNVEEQQRLAGGAGNVVFNLKTLGANVVPCGLLGEDAEGNYLKELFHKKGIETNGIFQSPTVSTIVKNRLIADFQQLIRVDFEKKYVLSEDLENQILDYIHRIIPLFHVVAISDYQKGFLTRRILREVIEKARSLGIPVVVDPKGNDFSKYKGATIIKPNAKEAYQAANLAEGATIEQVAAKLLDAGFSDGYIITRSEHGMAYFTNQEKKYFPVRVKEVVDVTGAGDTALAMITFCLANQLIIDHAIPLANIASSIAIEKIGCAHVALSEVAQRLLEFNLQDKFLPLEHLEAFKPVIKATPYCLYLLEEIESIDFQVLEALKKSLSKNTQFKNIVYFKKTKNTPLLLQILSSFQELDFILVDKLFVETLLEVAFPETIEIISKDSNTVICAKEALASIL